MDARSKAEQEAIINNQRRSSTSAQVTAVKSETTLLPGMSTNLGLVKAVTDGLDAKLDTIINANNVVSVMVVDSADGTAIDGAMVTISEINKETVASGGATFRNVPAGVGHTMTIENPGYTIQTDNAFTVVAGVDLNVLVKLVATG